MQNLFTDAAAFGLVFGSGIVFFGLLAWTVHLQVKHKSKNNKKEK